MFLQWIVPEKNIREDLGILPSIRQYPQKHGKLQDNIILTYDKFVDANSIFLCEQNVFTDRKEFVHHYCMKDDLNRILTTKMQAHIIELRKGLKITHDFHELSMLEKWILFLMCYEENSENPVIEQLIESEEIFKKAVEVLKVISEDQRIREQAFARNRFEKDMAQLKSDQEMMDKKLKELQTDIRRDLAYFLHGKTELEQEEIDLEQGMIEIEQGMAELKARKQALIEERSFEEKNVLIRQMMDDGLSDELIMKYARCDFEQIKVIRELNALTNKS